MLRIIAFVLSLALANVVTGDDVESDQPQCVINYGKNLADFPCNGYLSTDPKCNNSFLNIVNTSYYHCSEARIFWNYPMQNLTVTIESANYTKSKQLYSVSLTGGMLPTYRIYPNGKEFLITNTTAEKIVEISDENYQVVLKFQGPKRLTFYGAEIEYQVAPVYF
ncbi:unnamed protein product [Didymodactylos carnosus]|uniref:Uncharacterized protein n=1 Tax=Didymodactylos carnosus TaxID=1234261 RepID=A0A815H5G3_9BILA|nr:unnamed protein product [Didymodactylos carnosus]CAF1349725.1 unnamed protein product [Didymodactylos carnosus]CAF3861934.1 unnamed protein product [Didymodactylos carnosus]CAF4218745.1 unnamed protein product [Didymodactylos carnosus]